VTDRLFRRVAICFLLLRCITVSGYASDAVELYRKHITEIQPNSVTQLEGYLFSSASFIPRSQSSTAISGALKRAHFQAKIQIFDRVFAQKYNFEGLGLDEGLEGQFTASLRNVLSEGTHLDLSGLQTVFQAKSEAVSKCVLAIPIENLEGFLSSDLDARQLILASAFKGNYELDPVVVSELSTFDQFEKVTSFWCRSLELNYQSEGFSDALNYKPISQLPKGLGRIGLLREDGFNAMNLQQGLKYSSLFLNFPPYARAIAEKARLENCPVTESVFLYFGACYPVRLPEQVYCLKSVQGRGLSSFIHENAGIFAYAGDTDALHSPSALNLNFIMSSGGGFRLVDPSGESPNYVKAGEAFFFVPPDLKLAEKLYSEALEDLISSNTCNMLGRCYTLNNVPVKAVVLLTQATIMNPKHPYAAANLALALHANGLTDEAINQAHRALENPDISDFGKNELKNLLNRIQ
jgi:hypothetical protein